jgi:hypothetical protein
MKSPPVQFRDEFARELVDGYANGDVRAIETTARNRKA